MTFGLQWCVGTLIPPKSLIIPKVRHFPACSTLRPHLLLQIATVRDSGRDVVKGALLTDDTWRALSLMSTWLLDEDFCEKYLKAAVTNKNRGGLGAATSGMGVRGMNAMGSFVAGDPTVALRVGAASNSVGGISTQALYAIAAGGIK